MVTVTAPIPASSPALLATVRRYRWPLPWRAVVLQALALWLATRALDVALTVLFTSGTPAQRLGRWAFADGLQYLFIGNQGYATSYTWLAAYFPLYPALLHPWLRPDPLRWLAPGDVVVALVVSNLGTLAAVVAVGLLAAYERRSARAAWAPMLLLAASPLGVFLAGAYAEGLFIALVAWALLAARRTAWTWAAIAACLAVVARPFGVLLVPVLLVEYGAQHGWWWRLCAHALTWPAHATLRRVALLVAAPAATFGMFVIVLWRQYGDPAATLHAAGLVTVPHSQRFQFGHVLRWPWQTLGLAWQQLVVRPHWSWATAHLLLDLLPVLLCLAVVVCTARRAPLAWTLLTCGVVLLCLVTPLAGAGFPDPRGFPDPIASGGRYCYAAVPVLLQLGAWVERWPRWMAAALIGLSLLLQGILTVFVLRGGWLV